MGLHEVEEAADVIYNAVDPNANIIFGAVINENLKEEIKITVIAAGFHSLDKIKTKPDIKENKEKDILDSFLEIDPIIGKKENEAEIETEKKEDKKNFFNGWKQNKKPEDEILEEKPEMDLFSIDNKENKEKEPTKKTEENFDDFDIPAFIRNRG